MQSRPMGPKQGQQARDALPARAWMAFQEADAGAAGGAPTCHQCPSLWVGQGAKEAGREQRGVGVGRVAGGGTVGRRLVTRASFSTADSAGP